MRFCRGCVCVVALGACMVAPGGMCGCSGGMQWLLQVGHAWLLQGACMVAPGVCMAAWGHVCLLQGACVLARGACMVAPGGHAYLLLGGMHGCFQGACVVAPGGQLPGGACVVAQGGMCGCSGGHAWLLGGLRGIRRDTEIRSMSGQYASYWNAFLFYKYFAENCMKMKEFGPAGGAYLVPP